MPNFSKIFPKNYEEVFKITQQVHDEAHDLLKLLNKQKIKLFDLPVYQRIFLFIFTRTIKTYSAICLLCQHGYGQDVSAQLRNLLENLITVKYILHDESSANETAARFVAYKWIIFKRPLPEQEKNIHKASEEEKQLFFNKKKLILQHVTEFKEKFKISSDRALLTWSGKTVRDMARQVDKALLKEYETTFRLCSRFAHSTILGDNEYVIQEGNHLIFSPLPSPIGIVPNLKHTIKYFLNFLFITDSLFQFHKKNQLRALENQYKKTFDSFEKNNFYDGINPEKSSSPTSALKECTIVFKTHP